MELLVRPEKFTGRVENFGYEYLSFENVKLGAGAGHEADTAERELAVVLLGGRCSVASSRGEWRSIGARAHVFDGRPHTLYLPPRTRFQVSTEAGCDLALCYCKAEEEHPPRLVPPEEVEVEIRGGGNATRQIHHMIRPDFPAHRLLVVEVYTPAGNWSSYPPHKHDVHNPPGEVDLEELYYYRIRRPEGYAIQKVYTKDRRIDATLTVRDGEMVLVPEGYHPVVAAHGYDAYYLNALAGSARSMAASDDPDYAWVRGEWRDRDPRLPLVR
ncbi:MAG TPA: 5-deoxy-glucuronate isomerase [Verrucomicrobiae bacterium]|nr:5-deoxy-glucuronate isomerase [Verrucomicrobiae bacterium]